MTHTKRKSLIAFVLTLLLACVLVGGSVLAQEEARGVVGDNNPAIAVAQKTSNSVVGVITNTTTWSRQQGQVQTALAQGSGVVIREGYVLTNFHVVDGGDSFQVALPSGETVDAQLVGGDESTDLAILKVDSSELTPVELGVSSDLLVGSTVIAIGNPGGTVLANTVTSGIVSALERTSVSAGSSQRTISYIQHDAAINSGNSGGGLFNINGELVGINTLKYGGSMFSSVSYEGLGFAIPIDMAKTIVDDLIEYGKVLRPQMGVTVATVYGPDEPLPNNPPASVCVFTVSEGTPAESAALKPYDFITQIDGVRVNSLQDLTAQMDQHKAGDTVALTVVRYSNPEALLSAMGYGTDSADGSYSYGNFFGRYNNPSSSQNVINSYETLTLSVTLQILD